MTDTETHLIEGLCKQDPKAQQQMLAELRKSVEITAEGFQRRNLIRKLAESVCALLSPVL